MDGDIILDKRLSFNEDVENYDKWRPIYCNELFYDIMEYSQVEYGKKVIEVGIGTGQATKPFLDKGCTLKAVELGKELANYLKLKFGEYGNFTVCNTAFETFECPDDSIDLIYSATAFHWIKSEIGYPKVSKFLKQDGTLALFWNRPFVSKDNDLLHQKIQGIYQKYRPTNTKIIEIDTERYNKRFKTIHSYGFKDIEFKLYHLTRTFSSDDYIALLNTYSDHRSMSSNTKKMLEDEIKGAIIEFGDVLNVFDTIDLYLAKK
ncbi:Methyltransferase domain-containing protein [Gracilibacillus orientalis]|uniref:Methyltransferase domain-containing protein n=1 Tax=Gracilibacillus orientalis TaxID=334253 RepID=A0A1I4MXY7_9BACI|nr:class I SAM-dependent methyltransferase [Gracilibacillus orientalis]SFM08111.1 Methyltransferase domain-containing protein [Gracilibacillus orientalis]